MCSAALFGGAPGSRSDEAPPASSRPSPFSPAGPPARDPRALSVLIVEDEPIVAVDLQQMLRDMAYDAFAIATSGERALAIAAERAPDAVLMDVRLAGPMDGIETARLLREHVDAPILFLTAHADETTLERAKQAEPHGYLVKPVRAAEVRSALDMAVHKHRSDRHLRRREQWFATTLRAIGDAVVSVDLDGRVTFMNPVAETLTGADVDHALGRPFGDVLHVLDGSGQKLVATALDRALREDRRIEIHDVQLRDLRTGQLRAICHCASPIHDQGRVIGGVLVLRDVTEQQRLRHQLEAADRLASLGTISAGIAHEINNPLAVVVANTDLLGEELERLRAAIIAPSPPDAPADPPPPRPDEIEQNLQLVADVRSAAARISEIVQGLRAFARPADRPTGAANVRRSIEWAVRATSHQLRHTARILTHLTDVPDARIDESQLGQVLVNLLLNAGQAMIPGAARASEVHITSRTTAAGRILIEVRDTGGGMSPEIQKRIFDPFFTTKSADVGTGLGLSICHGIVTRAGGEIEVESRLGEGATFRVLLGPTEPASLTLPPPSSEEAPGPIRGRLLVIDDQDEMRTVLCRLLRQHDVVAVSGGRPALDLLHAGEPFDLILSDLMMPEMSGQTFHENVLLHHPEEASKIVFLTAGAVTPEGEAFLRSVPGPTIRKPFDGRKLRATVQELLAARRLPR